MDLKGKKKKYYMKIKKNCSKILQVSEKAVSLHRI